MTSLKFKLAFIGFPVILLLIVLSIRSGVLVDTSLLPRFLVLTVLLLVTIMLLTGKRFNITCSFIDIAFLSLYLWSLFSAAWAVVPSEALAQSQVLFVSCLVFIIVRLLSSRNAGFEKVYIFLLLLAMIFSFILAGYRMSVLEFFDPYRIISISANNNLYAGFLLIALPFALSGYTLFKGFIKYLSLAVATAAVFFIVITQSRAVYLGLTVALVLFLTLLFSKYRQFLTRKNLLSGGVAMLLLLISISVFYSSLDPPRRNYFLNKIPVWQYFMDYDDGFDKILEQRKREKATLTGMPAFDYAGSYYENANLRIIFWKKSVSLFVANPWLGVGAGNWRINIASCPQPENPDHTFKNYTYSQPHNEWIGILTELGIPGIIFALVAFCAPVLIAIIRVFKPGESPPFAAIIYASFILGFYLFACFDFPFKRIEHNVMLFSALALLTIKSPSKIIMIPGKKSSILVVILMIFALIFTTALVSMRIRGEYYTLKMFRNEGKVHENVIFYGQKANNLFYRLTPNTLPLSWFIGAAQFRLGKPDQALVSFSEALKVTPYEVRVMNDHATALFQAGNKSASASELRHVLRIDPFFDDARFNLAAILFYDGRCDTALALVKGCRDSQKKKDFLSEMK